MIRKLKAWWPFAAGLLAATGQAPLSLWPLAIAGFALLFLAFLKAPRPRSAAFAGWAFGTGYFMAALSWIVEPFMVDAAHDAWMAPFALIFLSAGLALFWGGALWLAKWICQGSRWRQAAGFTGLLTLAEALRGWIFTGFPWALIGHGLIDSPLLGWAAIGGALLLTALLLLAAVCFGSALDLMIARSRRRAIAPAIIGVVLIGAFSASDQCVRPVAIAAGPDAPVIRLVQPNATQKEKWDPDMVDMFFQRQLDYTAAAPRPDLVVWPETAVPYILNRTPEISKFLANDAGGIPVAFGIRRTAGTRIYNSMAVTAGDGKLIDVYDKYHLVPFGEYIPFGDFLQKFGISAFASQTGNGFSAGSGPQVIDIPGVGAALPLICYEVIFPRDIRDAPRRPDFLLQITNDAWFGSFSGPYQHLEQARLRSAEQGLPMVRVANTGVSALISADGKVLDELPLNKAGYMDVRLPPPSSPTLYADTGDLPMILFALILLAVGSVPAFTRNSPAGHK